MNILNKTHKYVTVNSITVYYNSEVKNVIFDSVIELPPDTFKDIPMSNFLSNANIKKVASFLNVDKKAALSTYLNFGLGIKYRVVDQNMDKSLYKTNKYNLYNVLKVNLAAK